MSKEQYPTNLYLLMRKLIRQYEEKNRIIEEIEKNLRMVRLRGPKPQFKSKSRLTSISFKLDLPTINVRHEYTPRSVYGSPEKKSISLPPKQVMEEKITKKPSRLGIQTISFNNEQESQIKPIILMNHRTTLRNFMLSTYRSQNANSKKQDPHHKEIFLSTTKFLLAKQDSRLMKERDRILEENASRLRLSDENRRLTIKSMDKASKQFEPEDPPFKQAKQVLKQIVSTEMPKIINDVEAHQDIDIKSFNTMVIAPNFPHNYRLGRKKTRGTKRSCSPWNSDRQGEELNEFWDASL